MMNEYFGLTCALILPLLVGVGGVLCLCRRNPLPLFLGLAVAWGIGWGILSHFMLIMGIARVPFSLRNVALPLFGLSCVLFVFYSLGKYKTFQTAENSFPENARSCDNRREEFSCKRGGRKQAGTRPQEIFFPVPVRKKGDLTYRFLWVGGMVILCSFIAYKIYFVFWQSLHFPISAWDAFATIAFKAKVFFYDRGLQNISHAPLPTYPLHVPLSMTWGALVLGFWDEYLLKGIFPFYFLSFIIIFYYFLRLHVSKWWATVGVVLLLSSNFLLTSTFYTTRDFPLLYYNCGAVFLLLFWQKSQLREFIYLAAIFSGMATFTKLEAMAYPVIHSILFLLILFFAKDVLRQKKSRLFLSFVGIVLGVFLIYFTFKSGQSFTETGRLTLDLKWENLARLPVVLKYYRINLFESWHWGCVWVLLLLTLSGKRRLPQSPAAMYLLITVLMFFGMWLVIFVTTINFNIFEKEVGKYYDLPRFFLHFFPLIIPLIVFWMNDHIPPQSISHQED